MEIKKIVEGMTAPQVAQVIDDNFKAQNKILEEDIAKQNNVIGVSEYKNFSEAEAVNVGDVRKYNGFLYECVEATTGAFDASKWKKSSFKAETEKKLSELGSNEGVFFYYDYGAISFTDGSLVENTIRLRTKPIKITGTGKKTFYLSSPNGIDVYYNPSSNKYAVFGYLKGKYIGALAIEKQNKGFLINCDGTFDEIIVSLRKGGQEITEEEKNNCFSYWIGKAEKQSYIIDIVGDNDNYVKGYFHSTVKGGNTYRIWVCNPDIDMSGVAVNTSGYDRFSIGLEESGVVKSVIKVNMTESLKDFYDFTAPNDKPFYNIRVNIRATKDEVLKCILEDITVCKGIEDRLKKSPSSSETPYDFAIQDEMGNAILAIEEGDLQTKKFNSKKSPSLSDTSYDFAVQDEGGNAILAIKEGDLHTKNFNSKKSPSLSDSSFDFAIQDEVGNTILAIKDGDLQTKNFNSKTVKQSFNKYERQTRFKVSVQSSQPQKTNFGAVGINSNIDTNIVSDYAVLYLPESYKEGGIPTKLIIFCKHGGTFIDDDEDPIFNINIFNYMLYLGYAVLGVDGVPDELVSSIGLDNKRVTGNYMAVQATKNAYDYVIDKYNVDRNGAFVFGYSQGGHYAQNVVDLSGIPVLACAELSPVCSMRYHQWDLAATSTINGTQFTKSARLNIARMFGFPEVQTNSELLALEYNQELVQGYDPWTRNVENPYTDFVYGTSFGSTLWGLPEGTTIDDIKMKKTLKAPLKIWCASNDSILGADVMKVFVKACKNAGQVCDIEVYSSGSHWIYREQDSIGNFTENGLEYNLYPLAKSIAVWFNSFGGYNIK